MQRTRRNQTTPADEGFAAARDALAGKGQTPGFAIEIGLDTNLGLAILLAEDEEGHCEPVAVVVSINEAREIAVGDMRRRFNEVGRGESPLCPYQYKVWAAGLDGGYRVAGTIPATEV
jgi:hypothetical protein